MSSPSPTRQGGKQNVSAKTARRAALKRAAAEAAARKRRQQSVLGALGGFIAVAVIIGTVWYFNDRPAPGTPSATASTAASATPAQEQPGAGPSLPAGLDTKPVVTPGTGELTELKVTPLVQGSGAAVVAGQMITVNYVGVFYKTGEEFDSSWKTNPPRPIPFSIGVGQVIPGWDQGLVGVKVGSRVQLDIPGALAYGEEGAESNGRPAGPLRFVVDILDAK